MQLEVALSPDQIEWLHRAAEARDVSVGHVIRAMLTARIREEEESSSREPEEGRHIGDGRPPSFAEEANKRSASGDSSGDNLLNRLRSMEEKLDMSSMTNGGNESSQAKEERGADEQKWTDPKDKEEERGGGQSTEVPPEAGSEGTEQRSMFDMVE